MSTSPGAPTGASRRRPCNGPSSGRYATAVTASSGAGSTSMVSVAATSSCGPRSDGRPGRRPRGKRPSPRAPADSGSTSYGRPPELRAPSTRYRWSRTPVRAAAWSSRSSGARQGRRVPRRAGSGFTACHTDLKDTMSHQSKGHSSQWSKGHLSHRSKELSREGVTSPSQVREIMDNSPREPLFPLSAPLPFPAAHREPRHSLALLSRLAWAPSVPWLLPPPGDRDG